MFASLSERFSETFRKISGRGRITEDNVREAMREVRTALLEADVHYDVVKSFCDDVVDDALGQEVTRSLKPGQEMIFHLAPWGSGIHHHQDDSGRFLVENDEH